MIPVSVDHDRLIAIGTVVHMADKHVNITERHPDFKLWEDHLKDARHIVETLRKIHSRDARENGACEKCDPIAFARAQRQKEHEAELAEFDKKMEVVNARP